MQFYDRDPNLNLNESDLALLLWVSKSSFAVWIALTVFHYAAISSALPYAFAKDLSFAPGSRAIVHHFTNAIGYSTLALAPAFWVVLNLGQITRLNGHWFGRWFSPFYANWALQLMMFLSPGVANRLSNYISVILPLTHRLTGASDLFGL